MYLFTTCWMLVVLNWFFNEQTMDLCSTHGITTMDTAKWLVWQIKAYMRLAFEYSRYRSKLLAWRIFYNWLYANSHGSGKHLRASKVMASVPLKFSLLLKWVSFLVTSSSSKSSSSVQSQPSISQRNNGMNQVKGQYVLDKTIQISQVVLSTFH